MEKDEKGKTLPRKVGMAPIQRENTEYEFTTIFDMIPDSHFVTVSKDRTGLFDGQLFQPSEQTGKLFLDWLNSATESVNTPENPQHLDVLTLANFKAEVIKLGVSVEDLENAAAQTYNVKTLSELTKNQATDLYKALKSKAGVK